MALLNNVYVPIRCLIHCFKLKSHLTGKIFRQWREQVWLSTNYCEYVLRTGEAHFLCACVILCYKERQHLNWTQWASLLILFLSIVDLLLGLKLHSITWQDMDFIMMPSSPHPIPAFITEANVPEKIIVLQRSGLFLKLNGTPQPEFLVIFALAWAMFLL